MAISVHPLDVLDQATSVVETQTLKVQGVRNLRILNRSKFLEIVRSTLEDYLTEALVYGGSSGDDGEPLAPRDKKLAREFQRRWQLLRTKHESGLEEIERRMERLATIFRTMGEVLQRWEEVAASSEPARELTRTRIDRMTLLREMLLDD